MNDRYDDENDFRLIKIARWLVVSAENDAIQDEEEEDLKANEIAQQIKTDYTALKNWINKTKNMSIKKALNVGSSVKVIELMNAIVDAIKSFK